MSTMVSTHQTRWSNQQRYEEGFTLVETMVVTAIFTMVLGGILALNLYSLRVTSGLSSQLKFDSKAQVLNVLANEVRGSQSAQVVNYNGTTFTSISVGQPQQGNALSLSVPSGSSTAQVYYWVDSSGQLYRWQTNTVSKLWLDNITNSAPFSVADFQGNVLSNLTARLLIEINLNIVDSNVQDFRQTMLLRAAVEKRN